LPASPLGVIEWREQMPHSEIVLPITTPETEWVAGRPLQKVSPTRNHARVQMRLASALDAWATGRGEVGTEWRFRIEPAGERRRPLVPDVAFVALDRLSGHSETELQAPAFAPTVAVEVLSPGDAASDVAAKIDVYLRAGCLLVIVADPVRRRFLIHDAGGMREFREDAVLQHDVLDGFALAVGSFFAAALDLQR